MAACAFLADFAACFASFYAFFDEATAFLASLTERAAFFADTEAAFLRLLDLESNQLTQDSQDMHGIFDFIKVN
jgi:hypothetical protein